MDLRFISDSWKRLTARIKATIICSIIALLGIVLLAAYHGFDNLLDYIVSARFYKTEAKRVEQIKKLEDRAAALRIEKQTHLDNEQKLANENAVLRRQNELTAEILRANDAELNGKAARLADILKQQQEKFNEIENLDDFDAGVCALCADVDRAGYRLSAEFCGKCSKK